MTPLADEIRLALGEVFDPCSVIAATPLSILDMGLVTQLDVTAAGEVSLILRPTSPACTLIARILEAAEEKIRAVPGITKISARIDNSTIWTEEAISSAGRDALSARRTRSRSEVPVKPRQWETTRLAPAGG